MSKDSPFVSFVINNYNYGQYLREAVLSALNQTGDISSEVVVVDDGSTDGSLDVLREFQGEIRLVRKQNGGQASAFNRGFHASTGKLIWFVDSDDALTANALTDVYEQWQPGASYAQGHLRLMDSQGRDLGPHPSNELLETGDLWGRILQRYWNEVVFAPTSGLIFSRRALSNVLPLSKRLWRINADTPLVICAASEGRVALIDSVIASYRLHGANAWATLQHSTGPGMSKQWHERIEAMRLLRRLSLVRHIQRRGESNELQFACMILERSWTVLRELIVSGSFPRGMEPEQAIHEFVRAVRGFGRPKFRLAPDSSGRQISEADRCIREIRATVSNPLEPLWRSANWKLMQPYRSYTAETWERWASWVDGLGMHPWDSSPPRIPMNSGSRTEFRLRGLGGEAGLFTLVLLHGFGSSRVVTCTIWVAGEIAFSGRVDSSSRISVPAVNPRESWITVQVDTDDRPAPPNSYAVSEMTYAPMPAVPVYRPSCSPKTPILDLTNPTVTAGLCVSSAQAGVWCLGTDEGLLAPASAVPVPLNYVAPQMPTSVHITWQWASGSESETKSTSDIPLPRHSLPGILSVAVRDSVAPILVTRMEVTTGLFDVVDRVNARDVGTGPRELGRGHDWNPRAANQLIRLQHVGFRSVPAEEYGCEDLLQGNLPNGLTHLWLTRPDLQRFFDLRRRSGRVRYLSWADARWQNEDAIGSVAAGFAQAHVARTLAVIVSPSWETNLDGDVESNLERLADHWEAERVASPERAVAEWWLGVMRAVRPDLQHLNEDSLRTWWSSWGRSEYPRVSHHVQYEFVGQDGAIPTLARVMGLAKKSLTRWG